MSTETTSRGQSLTAVPQGKLVGLLQRAGARHATPDSLQADLEAGAPVNEDGTVNLIAYTAWLVERIAHAD